MVLHTFLLLPNEHIFLEKIETQADIERFIKDVSAAIRLIRGEVNAKLYYDKDNIAAFLTACDAIADKGTYLNNIQYQLQNALNISAVNIKTKPRTDPSCVYILWNYNKIPIIDNNPPQIITEITEYLFAFKDDGYLLLNMGESIEADRKVVLVFKDAPHIKELPSDFARIPFVTGRDELELWIKTKHIQNFSLLDRTKFRKTSHIEQGQAVFLEIKTNRYWYLDNLHKNEYEVFDSIGMHIGVADLDGNIDTEERENGRKIDI